VSGDEKLYTIPVAAKETGVPERTLRFAIGRGEIPYTPLEGTSIKLVTLEAIETWKKNPAYHRPGRKKSAN
jgi:hypothetical protein